MLTFRQQDVPSKLWKRMMLQNHCQFTPAQVSLARYWWNDPGKVWVKMKFRTFFFFWLLVAHGIVISVSRLLVRWILKNCYNPI